MAGLIWPMQNQSKQSILRKRAQTASELAIFGAVLLFVISLIFRTGLSASQSMNQQLRAMRMALTESYRTAQGQYSARVSAGRNSAGLLVLEDRLSVDAGSRFGTRDRTPFLAGGSGTFSMNLFLPIDWGETQSLPMYDVFVNGQRFPFTTAGFKSVRLVNPDGTSPLLDCSLRPEGGACWQPNCFNHTEPNPTCQRVDPADPNSPIDPATCVPPGQVTLIIPTGCAVFYKVVGNFLKSPEWCGGTCTNPNDETTCSCASNMAPRGRFDLNFDGVPDVPLNERTQFMWQWVKVAGVSTKVQGNMISPPMEPGIQGIHVANQVNTVLDVDGDLKEETILVAEINTKGQAVELHILDAQEGDIDFSQDDRDKGTWRNVGVAATNPCGPAPSGSCPVKSNTAGGAPLEVIGSNLSGGCAVWRCQIIPIGIRDELQMYSFTRGQPSALRPGTLFRIEQGKLFDPVSGQFIRNTSRQDHVDIISRTFKISNDTDRLCDASGVPTDWTNLDGVLGLANPVEACNNCMSAGNIERTCLDEQQLIIFIRSRLEDLRGRRWVTRMDPQLP